MPVTKSAIKAARVAARKKKINSITRTKVKKAIKSLKIGIDRGGTKTSELFQKAQKEIDIAAKKNVISKNKAARIKSRLSKKISAEAKATKTAAAKTTKTAAKAAKKTTKKVVEAVKNTVEEVKEAVDKKED